MKRLPLLLFLLAPLALSGQDNTVDEWQKKLQSFYSSAPPVIAHLLFNQPRYARGDTAFFRAAFVTAEEMLPIKGSQILMVDLISDQGKVELHQEFRVKNGWDGSQIIIPQDLNPGRYRIKAYCDWLKNLDSSLFFTGELEVAGENAFESIAAETGPDYFPEGGKLVEGLKNRVVVQATPGAGKGIIADEQGKTVADFFIGSSGYGFFYITPESRRQYTLVLGQQTKRLSPPEAHGIAMLLTANAGKNSSHRILLQATPDLRQEDLHVIASGHGTIYYSALLQFNDKEYVAVNIPTLDLPAGVSTIAVLRATGEELASRLVYTNKGNTVDARITLSKTEFIARDNVSMKVSIRDSAGKPLASKVSVSVYNEDLLPGSVTPNQKIQDYLSGYSNVTPGGLTSVTSWDSPDADQFLITRKWPWYNWKQVLTAPEKPKHYFDGYQKLNGKLTAPLSESEVAATGSKLTFYFESSGDVYEFEADPDGRFTGSLLFDFYDRDEVFYRAERNGRKLLNTSVALDERAVTYSAVSRSLKAGKANPYYQYAAQRNLVSSSYQFFYRLNSETAVKKEGANAQLEDEMWGAEFEIDLDDYTIFPTMQETVHEIIPWLQNRKRDGKDVLRLYLPDRSIIGKESPAFLIDGILTDDSDYFLSLKPVNVDKIKLITSGDKLSKLGALGKNGLVLVETKIQDNAKHVSRNNSTFLAWGLTRPIPFSPQRSWHTATSRVPRMQPCLYWNANLPTNNQGEAEVAFPTSDDTGSFRIVIEGLTLDGRPFRSEETFRVNFGRVSH